MASHHVVVDGSNIATEGRSTPSLAQLDEAVRSFVAQHPHDKLTVVVDATFGHRIDPSERPAYEEAVLAGELVSPPAGAIGRGDAFVLQIADVAGADVFSNDSFQEFHGQYQWLFDEGRLIGGKPVPEVGWVFVLRSPVRGPTSRRSTRDTRTTRSRKAKATQATVENTPKLKAGRGGKPPTIGDVMQPPDAGADIAEPTAATGAAGAANAAKAGKAAQVPRQNKKKAATPVTDEPRVAAAPVDGAKRIRRRRSSSGSTDAINETMPFLEFVGSHAIGSEVEGTVDRFSSHGAYVVADGAQCYIPLRSLGDPPPRSAREVLTLGETRTFLVASVDASRRGIDLVLASEPPPLADPGEAQVPNPEPDVLPDHTQKAPIAEEAAPMAAEKRAGAKKAPTKKATAKKSTTKSTAKKVPVKKTTAKKSTAKKTTTKKSTAKKAPAKKSTAKKAPAKKATAKKNVAKKAPVKASTAKKTATKKSTAKKAPAKKASPRTSR